MKTKLPDRIQLGHGGGGRLSRDLIEKLVVPRFGHESLRGLPDAAALRLTSSSICFATDSFVVQPIHFPGGNIGDLAVHGTVNDLAVSGAEPRFLSLGMILEEGLLVKDLEVVLDAVQAAASACGVAIVTGDTKVVARGQCDSMFLNTAGIGIALPGFGLDPAHMQPGDVVLASGTLGDHGMAVMAARAALPLQQAVVSDTGPVHRLVRAMQSWADGVACMRDPTRGGAAAALNEMVEGQPVGIVLEETSLPFDPAVRSLAEILGLDLLHVASEGRMLAVCRPQYAEDILAAWRALPEGANAVRIGTVTTDAGRVVLQTGIGGTRLVDIPQGELLPRIC